MRANLAQREPEKESYRVSTRVDRYSPGFDVGWPPSRPFEVAALDRAGRWIALLPGSLDSGPP